MNPRLIALFTVILAFGALTTKAILDVGIWGIFEPHFRNWGPAQVFWDLVISCSLICFWLPGDARSRGIPAWPFILATLLAGSFGPLFYLVYRELKSPPAPR